MEITTIKAKEIATLFDGCIMQTDDRSGNLLGILTTERSPGAIQSTVKSTKFGNCILNWKKWLFDVIPVSVGAVTVIPDGLIAAILTGLQAIKSAVDAMQIELSSESSIVILNIVRLQRSMELSSNLSWIPVTMVKAESLNSGLTEDQVLTILHELERIRVLCFDLNEENVSVIEKIVFTNES